MELTFGLCVGARKRILLKKLGKLYSTFDVNRDEPAEGDMWVVQRQMDSSRCLGESWTGSAGRGAVL